VYVFQANRTADLVHKLMNVSDDAALKEEVIARTVEIIHVYSVIGNSRVGLLMFQILVLEQFAFQH
jgi:hypothetical protein